VCNHHYTKGEKVTTIKAQDLKEGMRIKYVDKWGSWTTTVISDVEIDATGLVVDVEGYEDEQLSEPTFDSFPIDEEVEVIVPREKTGTFYDYLPEGNFTEEDLWDAIAESHGLDVSEIMDGDLAEWL
jgi:hypothetical protein